MKTWFRSDALARRVVSSPVSSTRSALIEGLECRRLLSAKIGISGNGVGISAGDTTPARADYTDFGPMALSGTVSQATRSFTVKNTGTAKITFSGKRQVLGGEDAGQFKITKGLPTSLAKGKSATITVVFDPSTEGTQRANLTISSSASAGNFKFDIKGDAVKTSTLANGLQVAILKKGKGAKAKSGQVLEIDYTGFRKDGKVFDSSLATGRDPIMFALGTGSVIQGWHKGLDGTLPGDKRVLFIPSLLGYGTQKKSDDLPPNTDLIFETTTVRVGGPSIKVSGNSKAIADGDSVPTRDDFTDLGSTKKGKTITKTFLVTADLWDQNSNPQVLPEFTNTAAAVLVTGSAAKDFTIGSLTGVSNGVLSFTVTFKPSTTGARNVTISIPNNNPADGNYTFAITGKGT